MTRNCFNRSVWVWGEGRNRVFRRFTSVRPGAPCRSQHWGKEVSRLRWAALPTSTPCPLTSHLRPRRSTPTSILREESYTRKVSGDAAGIESLRIRKTSGYEGIPPKKLRRRLRAKCANAKVSRLRFLFQKIKAAFKVSIIPKYVQGSPKVLSKTVGTARRGRRPECDGRK